MTSDDVLTRAAPPPDFVISYRPGRGANTGSAAAPGVAVAAVASDAAVDQLPALVREFAGAGVISDAPVILAGHSAGGHLALWAAARHRLPPDVLWHRAALSVPAPTAGVVALAAVSDLAACHASRLG